MKPKRSVIAIPPSYDKDEKLETTTTAHYVRFLESQGTQTVMTTAGTSQFNLLTTEEIHELNKSVAQNFTHQKILGVPMLSTYNTIEFIKKANAEYVDDNSNLMLLYPDRYYNDETLSSFVLAALNHTKNPYLHAQKMRGGPNDAYDYNASLVSSMCADGLAGIKEEHSNLQKSFNFVKSLPNKLDIIVAGGSLRRFLFLEAAGANSLLSGVGNLFPKIENNFFDSNKEERQKLLGIETKFFNVAMSIGWHRALRESLKILLLTCENNRKPWPELTELESLKLKNIIEEVSNE